jgi:hypothetical protein
VTLDAGIDPREVERPQQAAHAASRATAAAQALAEGDVWPRYLADLAAMATPGGAKKLRGLGDLLER